ncbi:MAG: HAD hydrolase family protein [Candidatus Melainabacteria bacterium]|nr:MAG: HAD hydrolase family protein [Candidatus Melainabacteria bacterium]
MIKMVVTDIDGTILKKDFTVSNNVINAINELTKKTLKSYLPQAECIVLQ